LDKALTLPPRLEALAELVPPGRPVADIGTDHALLAISLVQRARVPRAIASDVSPICLAKARAAVMAAGLTDRIDLRLGAGLTVLSPGEVPVVVIAGMGAQTIAAILTEGDETARRTELFLLQPMQKASNLRRYLLAHGLRLTAEKLVWDCGRFYVIMSVVWGSMPAYSDELLEIGPLLVTGQDPLLKPYLESKIEREKEIWTKVKAHARSTAGQRRAQLAARRIQAWEALLHAGSCGQGNQHR
jgi:tRNA (adenine22-N1)-methyltransferase